jgi:glycosyltransferase involved in cell wall biosynthesis
VGHSGFGSTLFLPELFPDTPIINYFEYFYHPHNNDMDFRRTAQIREQDVLRSRARNAMILLDMETCSAGYTPTYFQMKLMPDAYADKIRVLHDGIDTNLYHRDENVDPSFLPFELPDGAKIVTYVSRGFESLRGFDIFMKAAKKICDADPDVIFLVVGSDRVCYGGDLREIKEKTFKEHILKQDKYDLSRIRFIGQVPTDTLAKVFSLSDLHIYLTVPFVLSWSLLDAMACGCTVLASDTEPLHEVIQHEKNGLLVEFFDADKLAATALEVLKDPQAHRQQLGAAAVNTIRERYSMETVMPQMVKMYEEVTEIEID